MWGAHCWKAWSSTQGAVALSSAEAEFYAMVDGAQRGKLTVAEEMGVEVKEGPMRISMDPKAAKSFLQRRALGKMRHIEKRDLWLQREVFGGKVEIEKVMERGIQQT